MSLDSGSISVLCVDDKLGFAGLTATFLERFSDQFSTSTAETAQQGLEFLSENRVDCIVSDHDMPGGWPRVSPGSPGNEPGPSVYLVY